MIVLFRSRSGEVVLGTPFVIVLFAQQLSFFFLQRSALMSLDRDGVLVVMHPAQYGLLVSLVLLAVFVVVYSAAGPARERESGAMETLFYGPVSAQVYVVTRLLAMGLACLVSLLFLGAAMVIGRFTVSAGIPGSLAVILPYTMLVALSLATMGLWAGLYFRHGSTAVTAVTALVVLTIAVSVGDLLLAGSSIGGTYFAVFLRGMLSRANSVLRYVLPLGLFLDDLVRYESYGSIEPFRVAYHALYGGLFSILAVTALRHRGVTVR